MHVTAWWKFPPICQCSKGIFLIGELGAEVVHTGGGPARCLSRTQRRDCCCWLLLPLLLLSLLPASLHGKRWCTNIVPTNVAYCLRMRGMSR